MIFRDGTDIVFETKEDLEKINKMHKKLKLQSKGDKELFKKLFQDYCDSFPMK